MVIIVWILKLVISALPSVMLGLPFWATFLILLALFFLPIPFLPEIYWGIGLIGAFLGPQDGFAIAYYVLTLLPVFSTIMKIVALKYKEQ